MFSLVRCIIIVLAAAGILLTGPPRMLSAAQTTTETLSFTFINPSIGWRVTQRWNGTTGSRGAIGISRTNDGGLHWTPLCSVPGLLIARILFADRRNGWLYGSRLYATHDGGRTWRRMPLHGSQTMVDLSGTSVWRLDSACGTAINHCHFTLLRSVAGSEHWHLASRPPVAPRIGSSITRANAKVAWITGGASPTMNSQRLALVATTDGGTNWQRLPMPCNRTGFGALYGSLVAYTAVDLWLFCASEPSAGSQAKSVFRSFDGGHSWRLIARSPVFGNSSAAVGSFSGSGYLNDVAVTSPNDAWVALGRGTLIHSGDGGRTWHQAIPIQRADPGGGGVGPIQFVDPRHGWLLSFPSLLFRTIDGGQQWQAMEQ